MKKKMNLLFALIFAYSIVCAQERIIVLNEGLWQSDNGKITYFKDGEIVSNQWFRDVNGQKLGDTPNDIIQVNNNLIAIGVNWSNIVQFITPEGRAVAATENIPNNRKLATDGKYVYVSSYGHECTTTKGVMTFTKGYVAKIDISTFKVVDACEVGYEPDGIAYYKGYLFVANTGGYGFQEDHGYETTISIIDAEDMRLIRNVDTQQPNLYGKMSQTGQYLCINSPGDYYEIQAATIIFDCDKALNGNDNCFVKIDYPSTYSCATRDNKFFTVGSSYSIMTGMFEFFCRSIDPKEIMETEGQKGISESLPGTMRNDIMNMESPYGIYVNPYTGYMYATDAGSYASSGHLIQWSPDGELLGKHKTYINPAHFLALPPNGASSGINGIGYDNNLDGSVYDLYGRKRNNMQKGINIVKGKKVLRF